MYIGLDENSVLTVMQRRLNLRICAALSQVMLNLKIVMKVLKAQGKNYLAEPDVIVHKSALL